MTEPTYLDLAEQYEAIRRLEAELMKRQRQAASRVFLTAWAQMMHGAPGHAYFGNGLWFNNQYQPLVTEVPIRG